MTSDENNQRTIDNELNASKIAEEFQKQQNLALAIAGGALATLISALIWALATVLMEYQIGWMAIGVGFFVGISVRFFGRGIDKSFAVTGAILALLGCIFGNLFSIIGFIAKEESLSLFQVIFQIRPGYIFEVFPSTVGPMDFLFYALALYEGYKFSTIPLELSPEGINRQLETARSPLVRSRTKLVMVGYLLLVFLGIGSRFFAKNEVRYYYDSGELRSKGNLKNGTMHGQWTFYFENGIRSSVQFYQKGKLDSVCTWWDEKGCKVKVGEYRKGLSHGKWTFYTNDTLTAEGMYLNDRQHGHWTYFFENGIKSQECYYTRDRLDSLCVTYYSNGNKRDEGFYVNGIKTGSWKSFDSTGTLKKVYEYHDDTVLIVNFWDSKGNHRVKDGNGTYVEYFPNGTTMKKGSVIDKIKAGIWTSWHENGKMMQKALWNDSREKVIDYWHDNGTHMVKNGTGEYIVHNDSGSILIKGQYTDSSANGLWHWYYDDGTPFQTCEYVNGRINGSFISYNQSGNKLVEGNMKDDKKEGKWVWYHENSDTSSAVNFINGKKDGVQIFFDEYGSKLKEEHYKNGELTKEFIL